MSWTETWKTHKDLIKWLTTIFTLIGGAIVFVGGLILNNAIDNRIDAKVSTTATVAGLTTSVALNTDAIEDLSTDVGDLAASNRELNTDVKETLRILSRQTQ